MSGTILSGKRILMFCAEFFGYGDQMAKGLRALGCEVDLYDERINSSALIKAMIRYNIGLVRPLLRKYFADIIHENKDKAYDYVFVVKGEALNEEIICMLRSAYPTAAFILYLWDAVKNIPDCENRMKLYDRVFTFDPVDAEKYHLSFRSLFYGSDFPVGQPDGDYTYDICFIGTAHSIRPRVVKKMAEYCERENLRFYYFLYSPHFVVYMLNRLLNPSYRYVDRKDIQFKPISREQMQHVYKQSRCILDVEHPSQSGITTRPLEMLKMQKKIITTNQRINQFDFYKPQNFLVINPDVSGMEKAFIYEDYVPANQETMKKYSVKGFLEEVFLGN